MTSWRVPHASHSLWRPNYELKTLILTLEGQRFELVTKASDGARQSDLRSQHGVRCA